MSQVWKRVVWCMVVLSKPMKSIRNLKSLNIQNGKIQEVSSNNLNNNKLHKKFQKIVNHYS
jgi:hypothetical protein